MAQQVETVSAEAVRAELDRILGSAKFDASERNRRFLTHVVEQALAGQTDRIKAYSIATAVFGRDERFDPQLDSIVRIEAGRLRRALERYGAGGGAWREVVVADAGHTPYLERPAEFMAALLAHLDPAR